MFKKIKKEIKNYFSEIFNKNNLERGIAIIPILFWVGISAAIGWWTSTTFKESLAAGLGAMFMSLGSAAVSWSSGWLSYVLNPSFVNRPIVGYQPFDQVWGSVRDMANMLIVLGFVVVGIATTIRWQEYAAKKLLPTLIGVALLINFSGLFCGTIINGANITANALLQQGAAGGMFSQVASMLQQYGFKATTESDGAGHNPKTDAATYLGAAISMFIIDMFASWIFMVFAILLAARYGVLACLYILSPLAMVFFVFPATRSKWSEWIHEFLNWSFLGVTTGFFIYLAMNVLVTGVGGGNLDLNIMFISFIFLYVGYKMAKKGAGEMAGAATKLVGGTIGLAMGTGVGLAMGGARGAISGAISGAREGSKGGLTGGIAGGAAGGAKAAIKTGLNSTGAGIVRGLEGMGLLKEGTAAQLTQNKLSEEQKRYEAMFTSGNATDKARAQRAAKTGKGRERAAAFSAAVATESLNDTFGDDLNAIDNGFANAAQFGKGNLRREATKQNYQIAGLDHDKVAGVAAARNLTGASGYQQARVIVEQEALANQINQMSTAQVGSIDPIHVEGVANYEFFKKNFDVRAIDKLQLSKNKDLINAIKDHIPRINGDIITAQHAGNMREVDILQKKLASLTSLPNLP